METLKELLGSIRLQLAERTSNPLTGAFLIAWPITNYRLFIVLAGDGEWQKKIDYIDKHLYPEWTLTLSNAFCIPFFFALFYVFLYPPIADRIVNMHKRRQIAQRKVALELESITPLTQDEANYLRDRIAKERLEWKTEKAQFQAEIDDMTSAMRMSSVSAKRQTSAPNRATTPPLPTNKPAVKSASEGSSLETAKKPEVASNNAKKEEARFAADEEKGTWRIPPAALPEAGISTQYKLADEGIPFRSARLLKFLLQIGKDISIPAIAEELHISIGEVKRRASPLVERELVEISIPDRTERITLTDLGRQVGTILVEAPDRW
jgi:hypothetical protein